MPKGFRPSLEPPSHRRVEREVRRPCFCLAVSITGGLLVFLIFAVSGWNVYDHDYSKSTNRYHAGDEISTAHAVRDFSDSFCDGYRVSSWERATAYLLSHPARVNESSVVHVPIHLQELPTKRMEVMGFYLLKGSAFNLMACRQNGSTSKPSKMFIIQGEDGYRKFHDHHPCTDCTVAEAPIPLDALCDGSEGHAIHLTAQINETDTYYFLVSYGRINMTHHHQPGIIVNGTLTRTLYGLQDAIETCPMTSNEPCNFDIPWGSDRDVVVRFNPEGGNVRTTLITRCQLRTVVWVFVFIVPPLLIFMIVSVLFGFVFCRKQKRNLSNDNKRSSRRQQWRRRTKRGDRTDLVENEVPQDEDHTITIQDE